MTWYVLILFMKRHYVLILQQQKISIICIDQLKNGETFKPPCYHRQKIFYVDDIMLCILKTTNMYFIDLWECHCFP